jgi:hypothetical protein
MKIFTSFIGYRNNSFKIIFSTYLSNFFNIFPSEAIAEVSRENYFETIIPITDKTSEYFHIENVRSQYHSSVPLKKLQYPEPFIASASFIHTDIGFIHVLQYNYWL